MVHFPAAHESTLSNSNIGIAPDFSGVDENDTPTRKRIEYFNEVVISKFLGASFDPNFNQNGYQK